MTLAVARSRLDDVESLLDTDPARAAELVAEWFAAFKEWERRDTFAKAFYDNRIAMRTWSDDNVKAHTLRIAANRISSRDGTQTATQAPELLREFDAENYQFAVGLMSLSQRTTPGNFNTAEGGSRKYSLGLHDMSSTLLDSRRSISEQAHKKDDGTIFSFSPLPEMDDHALFHRLNRLGKQVAGTQPRFHALVRDIRSRMTRVKLAAEHDMGTGFTAVRQDDGPRFKLKYGLGAFTKIITGFETDEADMPVPGSGKLGGGRLGTGVKVTPEMWQARRDQALNYKSVLERQLFAKNEITVAYRQHAGQFPVFARFNRDRGIFACFLLNEDGAKIASSRRPIVDDMPLRTG